jgi:dipeptide/tripeptide permease
MYIGGNGAGAPAHPHSNAPQTLKEKPAGALGGGLPFANAFVLLFKFLSYTLPVFGAWLGDTVIGRYQAIMLGVLLCGVAHVIQIIGAIPVVLQRGHGRAPFLISLIMLAFGTGKFRGTTMAREI